MPYLRLPRLRGDGISRALRPQPSHPGLGVRRGGARRTLAAGHRARSQPIGPAQPESPRPLSAANARTPKPSGGHSTASDLLTNARGRVRPGDAAEPPDEAVALADEKAPAGRIQHPLGKPRQQERRLISFFDPASGNPSFGQHRSTIGLADEKKAPSISPTPRGRKGLVTSEPSPHTLRTPSFQRASPFVIGGRLAGRCEPPHTSPPRALLRLARQLWEEHAHSCRSQSHSRRLRKRWSERTMAGAPSDGSAIAWGAHQ
jgi:hypothetical protein